jgi:hypothetical protein
MTNPAANKTDINKRPESENITASFFWRKSNKTTDG